MSSVNNPVLGYRDCPDCGGRGSIHKARGRRNALYQRCECGCVQSNGKMVQSRFYYETEWTGAAPEAPAGIYDRDEYSGALAKLAERNAAKVPGQIDRESEENQGLQPGENLGQVDDFDPHAGPIDPPKKEKGSGGLFMMLAVGLGVAAAMLRV